MFRPRSRFFRALAIAVSFAAVWGAMLAVFATHALTRANPWPVGMVIVVTGCAGALGALLALSFARGWMQQVLLDLCQVVKTTDREGARIDAQKTGWAAFDSLVTEFDRLARLRALRIEALMRQEARFRALADSSHSVEAWFDRTGALVWVNRAIERVTGYTPAECLLAPNLISLLADSEDQTRLQAIGMSALHGGNLDDFELRIRRKDGESVWVACHWQAMRAPGGRILGVRLSAENIMARKEAESRLVETVSALRRAQSLNAHYLQRSEDERLRLVALLDALRVGILFVDRDRRVYYWNRALHRMWGLDDSMRLSGVRDEDLMASTTALRADDEAFRKHLAMVLTHRASSLPFDIPLKDGRVLEEVSALVASDDGQRYVGRVWIYEDVTERKRTARRLEELAERDSLTQLYNRRRFREELLRLIAEANRRGQRMALLSFDLDGFKTINDGFGHQAGDAVLVEVARCAAATVRRNELLFRVGGDEFAVLVPDAGFDHVMTLARRITSQIHSLEFIFDPRQGCISASVGIAFFPDHASDIDDLIECADTAMYRAKAAGKNTFLPYGSLVFQGVLQGFEAGGPDLSGALRAGIE